jgi:predicted ATP-grasp superfamily ATP-dependent carboligase
MCGEIYWQERISGDAVAALVLANGNEAIVLGFSAQWCDPAPDAPFRYGGAVRPADLLHSIGNELAEAAVAVSREFRLVGLNSIDFLVDDGAWTLIEVNPRAGATLDIFRPGNEPLFALHVEACHSRLPASFSACECGAAAMIVYARRDVPSMPPFRWPDWAADRQRPNSAVEAGAPLCTVLAEADTGGAARRLVEERRDMILAAFDAG